ncbi:hypothetical protein SB521682_2626 [Shigella boydii 5216-82]|nr:hypothetical protein SB521682_2626 [Shigella boydii 5216-82]
MIESAPLILSISDSRPLSDSNSMLACIASVIAILEVAH